MPVTSILLFVEDPGAANMVIDLPQVMVDRGHHMTLMASGHAIRYLADRGVICQSIPDNMSANALLDKFEPDIVVTGTSENPDSFGLTLIDAANRRGIPSVGLVDMSCNADLRFRGRTDSALAHAPEYLIIPDATTRDAFLALNFPSERLAVLGHPQYDRVWRRRMEFEAGSPHSPQARPRWMFVAEGYDLLNRSASFRTPDYTLHGRGDTDWRTGIVLEEILDAAARYLPRPEIVVRLHPKNSCEDFTRWITEVSLDDARDPFPGLWDADVILGMSSMLLVEAAILGRPVLAVLPRIEERAWLGPLANGDIPSVTHRDALLEYLDNFNIGTWQPASQTQWFHLGATERIAEYLTRLL